MVSGGTGGLGRAVVDWLLERDARCVVPSRSGEPPANAPWAGPADRLRIVQADLTDPQDVRRVFESVEELAASLHLAGGFDMGPIESIELETFRRMFETNAQTCFLCCQAAVAAFRRQRAEGRIVNVAARPAVEPVGGMLAYTTSKAAVASITQCLAREVRPEKILVNAVLPSLIDTPDNRQAMPDADHASWPTPAQIAEAIVYLASPANTLTHGALLPVYGDA